MQNLKDNKNYIAWFIFNFLFFWSMFNFSAMGFIILSVIYAITVSLSFSNLGEEFMRILQGIREIKTNKEKEYLLPIFEEVYSEIKLKNPEISQNIKLYIIDTMTINAYSIGRNTIAVTNGIIHTLTKEQLKAVISHEFGHIIHKDTFYIILQNIGNGLFSIVVIGIRFCFKIADMIISAFRVEIFLTLIAEVLRLSLFLTKISFEIYIYIIQTIGNVLLGANSRKNEFFADKYAYDLGYGEEMISALYTLNDININSRMKLLDRLKATHPYTTERIEKLESL